MKIKCIKFLSHAGEELTHPPLRSSLAIGEIYQVMVVWILPDGRKMFGLVLDEKEGQWPTLSLHWEKSFEIVSAVSPSNWRVKTRPNGFILIGPEPWTEDAFLERFSDHEPETFAIFKAEQEIIMKEDN